MMGSENGVPLPDADYAAHQVGNFIFGLNGIRLICIPPCISVRDIRAALIVSPLSRRGVSRRRVFFEWFPQSLGLK